MFESRSSPVKSNFVIVVLARYERPDAVKFVVEALKSVVFPETERFEIVVVASVEVPVTVKNPVVVAFVVIKFVKTAVTAFKSVVKKLVDEALVNVAKLEKSVVLVLLVVDELLA